MPKTGFRAVVTTAILTVAPLAARAQATPKRADPVRADAALDTKHPPSMDELGIMSHGSRMNGFIYLPGGTGMHPIVLLLHGFPGNERNLDIAQALRRDGYAVLYFDYRGSWGSGGTFSFANSRDDVASALAWARDPANVSKYHLDVSHIALVGHSMGGWMAYQAAARDPAVRCVVGLAAWNIGYGAGMMAQSADVRASMVAYAKVVTDPAGGPLHTRAEDIVSEVEQNARAYDFLSLAPRLADRAILMVGATNDSPDENPSMNAKMEAALRRAGATRVRTVTYTDDHPFSAHRIALSELIVRWMDTSCAK